MARETRVALTVGGAREETRAEGAKLETKAQPGRMTTAESREGGAMVDLEGGYRWMTD